MERASVAQPLVVVVVVVVVAVTFFISSMPQSYTRHPKQRNKQGAATHAANPGKKQNQGGGWE